MPWDGYSTAGASVCTPARNLPLVPLHQAVLARPLLLQQVVLAELLPSWQAALAGLLSQHPLSHLAKLSALPLTSQGFHTDQV